MDPTLTPARRRRGAALAAGAAAVLVVSPTAATQGADAASLTGQQQVILLVNAQRATAGCRDMARRRYFSHTTPDGITFAQRIRAQGYTGSRIGENIAAGYPTASAVMTAWMKSPGHRANILNCRYTVIGVGSAIGGPYGYYWTQDFGG